MKPFTIECPCSPGETIYYLGNEGLRLLFVREIQVFKDYDADKILTAIVFSGHPYVILTDETRRRMFGTYDDALEALREFNKESDDGE